MRSSVRLLLLACATVATATRAAETIEVAGVRHEGAEMVEVCREGLVYRTGDAYVVLPWSGATPVQISAAKTKMGDAFANALHGALYVKGTVFEDTPDGVIVQIDLEEMEREKGSGYRNGAKVVGDSLVIVRDFPSGSSREEGAPVELVVFEQGTHTYDLKIAVKEIPRLVVAKPLWTMEQEWKNSDGQAMQARVVAVKDGKVMFEKAGNRFVYDLDRLDGDARKRIAEIAPKLEGFPLP